MLEPILFWGRFAAIALIIAGALLLARNGGSRLVVLREFALMAGGYLIYSRVRDVTTGSQSFAVTNAHNIQAAEHALGIGWEASWQDAVIDNRWLVRMVNNDYIYGHWPLIAVVAAWLFFRHRSEYYLMRTAFFISGSIGLIVFAFWPVAPPRLAQAGMVDTISVRNHIYTALQPNSITNQFAAMPSLHFGWDLLIGIAIVRCGPRGWRWLGVVPPALMLFSIVATGNHYLLDAAAGAAVSVFALGAAFAIRYSPLPSLDRLPTLARDGAAQARQTFLSLF
ncbi:MAG TPA: phosphatase PAP2 family protein [Dehalococcoidia bacterium]|nr:phosphatase PAP2 family protein [Dehalococcoidia bacterium]